MKKNQLSQSLKKSLVSAANAALIEHRDHTHPFDENNLLDGLVNRACRISMDRRKAYLNNPELTQALNFLRSYINERL